MSLFTKSLHYVSMYILTGEKVFPLALSTSLARPVSKSWPAAASVSR